MLEQYGEDSTVARVEVLGEFPRADDDTGIPMELIKAAVDRDVALSVSAPIIWGLDVARYGGDNSALCVRQGNTVLEIKSFLLKKGKNKNSKYIDIVKKILL